MIPKYVSHLKSTDKELSFYKQKLRLRTIYKQWKVGLLSWDDIDVQDQLLLRKYYGVEEL